jgi:hypothetical protein
MVNLVPLVNLFSGLVNLFSGHKKKGQEDISQPFRWWLDRYRYWPLMV